MDEQRRETDISMLQLLLNLSSPKETDRILQADSHLMDVGLLQTLYLEAPALTPAGLMEVAEFLQRLMASLMNIKGSLAAPPAAYLLFLGEVLHAVAYTEEPHTVYPLLQENLDKLDQHFAKLLRDWANAALPRVKPMQARKIAAQIGNLSVLIGGFPFGSRANNLEIEIASYEIVAAVFTREEFPEQWATLQNNLGNAYSERLQGNRAENLEQAIFCFQNALQVRTFQGFPEQWATLQNNLGNAYSDRIQGDRAANLETAIHCYQQALQVRTREAFPKDWAATQNNLGRAYSRRQQGDAAKNLERAIACYQNALHIYNPKSLPKRWATTQNNLANAYSQRMLGNRDENLEKAIDCYQKALQVRNRGASPEKWAAMQRNLGRVWSVRIQGEKAENLEQALSCYQNALQVYNPQKFPEQWAALQIEIGHTWSERLQGKRSDNLSAAITCYQAALQVYSYESFPEYWGRLQVYLGRAWRQLYWVQFNTGLFSAAISDYLLKAITGYHHGLQIYTQDNHPHRWAMLQMELGQILREAYIAHVRDSHSQSPDYLSQAIVCYENAAQIYTFEALPHHHAQTLFHLGLTYQVQGKLNLAYTAFAKAIAVVEFLRGQPIWNANPPSNLVNSWVPLYQEMVDVCLQLAANEPEYYAKAVEYVERHKARKLVETLINCDLLPKAELPLEILHELRRLRQDIAAEQQRVEKEIQEQSSQQMRSWEDAAFVSHSHLILAPNYNRLHHLWQQLDLFISNEIKPIDPFFCATQQVNLISSRQIQELLPDRNSAIITWAVFGEMLFTFILTPESPYPIVLQSFSETLEALDQWTEQYFRTYSEQKGRWCNHLTSQLHNLAELLHFEQIIACLPETCEHLILIPDRHLHFIPFHALPLEPSKLQNPSQKPTFNATHLTTKTLLDRFSKGIRYAPSGQLLRLGQMQHPFGESMFMLPLRHLFAVQTTDSGSVAQAMPDLVYMSLEVETIRPYFAKAEILNHQTATKKAIYDHLSNLSATKRGNHNTTESDISQFPSAVQSLTTSAHFAGFASLKMADPLQSTFLLGNGGSITLRELFDLDFSYCRFVTVSACEIDFENARNDDESLGFTTGLLYAGTPSIVSSLWTVSDLSTLFLMNKFYENLTKLPRIKSGEVALALNQAQQWLRDLTSDEFEKILMQFKPFIAQIFAKLPTSKRLIAQASLQQMRNRKPCPFANPYHWAGFRVTGF